VNIDDELRRMFGQVEDRLDVPVREDATETIVAGARRLRRRRVAVATASGAFAVAVLAGFGILLASPEPESAPPAITSTTPTTSVVSSQSSSSPPPSSSSSSRRPPAGTNPGDGGPAGGDGGGGDQDEETTEEPPPPPVTGSLIGPDGFGSIRLGMSYEELLAAGAIQGDPPPESGCTAYEFADQAGSGYVHLTAAGGAQAILPSTPTHTVEGVSHEWRLVQVRKVYPEVTREAIAVQNPIPVEVRGNPGAVYLISFVGDDVAGYAVTEITLRYADQPCV
jgi:hypothetical protein